MFARWNHQFENALCHFNSHSEFAFSSSSSFLFIYISTMCVSLSTQQSKTNKQNNKQYKHLPKMPYSFRWFNCLTNDTLFKRECCVCVCFLIVIPILYFPCLISIAYLNHSSISYDLCFDFLTRQRIFIFVCFVGCLNCKCTIQSLVCNFFVFTCLTLAIYWINPTRGIDFKV